MAQYEVETIETVTRVYVVTADDENVATHEAFGGRVVSRAEGITDVHVVDVRRVPDPVPS